MSNAVVHSQQEAAEKIRFIQSFATKSKEVFWKWVREATCLSDEVMILYQRFLQNANISSALYKKFPQLFHQFQNRIAVVWDFEAVGKPLNIFTFSLRMKIPFPILNLTVVCIHTARWSMQLQRKCRNETVSGKTHLYHSPLTALVCIPLMQ